MQSQSQKFVQSVLNQTPRRSSLHPPNWQLMSCTLGAQELGDLLCRRLDASRKAAQKVLGVLQVCLRRCCGLTAQPKTRYAWRGP